ncbi:MAG: hypothetical protein QXX19_06615 [Candidatus Caldarchaeum sp.]
MKSPGSSSIKKSGVRALAEAVLRTAFEDAMEGNKEAIEFIDSYNFDLWVQLLGMDPERMRSAVRYLLRSNKKENTGEA